MTRGWIVLALAVAISGCGYALQGHGSTLPNQVRRIGLPGFQNRSVVPELDRVFTEAVKAEFNSRGRFVVVSETTGVDAVLTGTILSVDKMAAATTAGEATKYNISVTASAEFKLATDVAGKPPYYANQRLSVFDEINQPTGAAVLTNLATFFSQDQNALDRLAKAFATKLVSSILEKF